MPRTITARLREKCLVPDDLVLDLRDPTDSLIRSMSEVAKAIPVRGSWDAASYQPAERLILRATAGRLASL